MHGPNLSDIMPDPVLTNVAANVWGGGGWIADLIAPVKQVPKDKYKFATWDKSVLDTRFEALRAPGARANMVPRPVKAYTEGLVKESSLRAEYTQEDIDNAISPDEPRITGTTRIINSLQYVVESRIHNRYLSSGLPAANKTAAGALWTAGTTYIQKDIENAKLAFHKRSGIEANYLLIPRAVWPTFVYSPEIKGLRVYTESGLMTKGLPDTPVFGLQLIVPGMRYDTAPTGTYTPAYVWNDVDIWIGYSPALAGGGWSGDAPVFCGQFEARLTGDTPFAVREYQSPFFLEDRTYIITTDFRRQDEVVNPELVYAVTGVN